MANEIIWVAAPPSIHVAGISRPDGFGIDAYLRATDQTWVGCEALDDPQALIEAAGRVCYASWHNPAQKTRHQYIRSSILDHAHGSVLEHVWLNLLIRDLPRSSQLELVRHGEGTAFSFESTRFTDRRFRIVIPPLLRGNTDLVAAFSAHCRAGIQLYCQLRDSIDVAEHDSTLTRKRKKEMARSVLPNALGSDGMVSLNARAARWIVQARSDPHADLSMREFAWALYQTLAATLPAVVADAQVQEQQDGVPWVRFDTPKV